jgi:hypothetical protein
MLRLTATTLILKPAAHAVAAIQRSRVRCGLTAALAQPLAVASAAESGEKPVPAK